MLCNNKGPLYRILVSGIFMHGPRGLSFCDCGLTFFFINVECVDYFADYGHRKS